MKYYVVDAFAEKVFEGNPAGVCIMEKWRAIRDGFPKLRTKADSHYRCHYRGITCSTGGGLYRSGFAIPFWADRLGKNTLIARQTSSRGGTLYCKYQGDRVFLSGYAALYLVGEIGL